MGNKRVVADPDRCIGCGTCMAGCIEKHDVPGDVAVPRLRVAKTWDVSAPVVCHHCDDAPCAKVCPTHAVFFDPANSRIGVDESKCIGCKNCMLACPFGAVSVVRSVGPQWPGGSKAFVIKCDLCVDRENGPACIEACPTKGIALMDDDDLEELSRTRRDISAEQVAHYAGMFKVPGRR